MSVVQKWWYDVFDLPGVYNSVRYLLLFGKRKMFMQIQQAVWQQEGESVLDIGCGTGELSALFFGEYLGVDFSERYVQYAVRKYPEKQFVQGNALQLPFPEKSYDTVLLASFIHHFSDSDVRQILKSVQRIARKKVVLLEPSPQKGNYLAWLLLKMDRGAYIRTPQQQGDLVCEYFVLENVTTFHSGFYKLSVLTALSK